MKTDWNAVVVAGCLLLVFFVLTAHCKDKEAFVICEGRCIQSITLGPKAQLITPMVNGKPDYTKSVMRGIIVKYDPNLEKVAMR